MNRATSLCLSQTRKGQLLTAQELWLAGAHLDMSPGFPVAPSCGSTRKVLDASLRGVSPVVVQWMVILVASSPSLLLRADRISPTPHIRFEALLALNRPIAWSSLLIKSRRDILYIVKIASTTLLVAVAHLTRVCRTIVGSSCPTQLASLCRNPFSNSTTKAGEQTSTSPSLDLCL